MNLVRRHRMTKKLSQNLNHKCIDQFLGRFVWFLQKHREGPHGETRDARDHLGSTGRALGTDRTYHPGGKTRPPGAASALTHDRCSTASSSGCAAGANGTDCRKSLGTTAPFIAHLSTVGRDGRLAPNVGSPGGGVRRVGWRGLGMAGGRRSHGQGTFWGRT